jgi:hypothetical protein
MSGSAFPTIARGPDLRHSGIDFAQRNKGVAMIANVGAVDRVIRIVVGLALISLLFVLSGPVRWIGLIGFIPLLTAIFGVCPLYSAFGLSTCHATETP